MTTPPPPPDCSVCGAPNAYCTRHEMPLCEHCAIVDCELSPEVLEARALAMGRNAPHDGIFQDLLVSMASWQRAVEGSKIVRGRL
jgi:hypothetical protein